MPNNNMPQKAYKNMTSRELCLEVIINVTEKGEFLKQALHSMALNNEKFDARERAFITTLVTGTVEKKIELDYIISIYSKVKTEKLKPYIRNILRMAIYQIVHMDKVPDNAAVNEAVKLAVKKGYSGLRGYVNGVLRNIVRTYKEIEWPDKKKDPVKYYMVKYSMPEWLVRHFLKELSDENMEICMEYFASKPDLTVRAVDVKGAERLYNELESAGYEVKHGNIFEYAFRLNNPGKVEEIPGYNEGRFVVQDESSMFPAHVAYSYFNKHMKENEGNVRNDVISILDMCAAPGGKIMHIRSMFGAGENYLACDVSEAKTEKIKNNLLRAGMKDVKVKVADALVKCEENKEKYDIIIADLPCSGLGVIAKKPDIKYNIQKEDLDSLAKIQKDMLDNAAYYVKNGGIIVYSTCTVNKAENEENCKAFLDRHSDFEKLNIAEYIPQNTYDCLTKNDELAVVPGKYSSDGFFVALFKKVCES